MQAYALARPAVQFRLHVLKAKNDKSDFVYAPKSNANVEDAVLKVIGRDCALQCDWTALETDGFEVHAFLPKPTAKATKIASQGAFISIDSRPVSNSRGTIKQVVAAFRERLRKSNSSFANVKDPFFTMNIVCPPDSYDPNIEPAKDDVMFDNGDVVLGAVDKLLMSYYPKAITYEIDEQELPMPEQEEQARSLMEKTLPKKTQKITDSVCKQAQQVGGPVCTELTRKTLNFFRKISHQW
jgi:DNA mismatch repair ATPase MutL